MVLRNKKNNDCIFCDRKSQKDFILREWDYWYIKHAENPYLWLKKHLVVIPKNHKLFSHEVTNQEYSEMREVQLFIKSFYKSIEYFSFARETLWKREVEHLSYHFVPWIISRKNIEKILEKNKI